MCFKLSFYKSIINRILVNPFSFIDPWKCVTHTGCVQFLVLKPAIGWKGQASSTRGLTNKDTRPYTAHPGKSYQNSTWLKFSCGSIWSHDHLIIPLKGRTKHGQHIVVTCCLYINSLYRHKVMLYYWWKTASFFLYKHTE